MISGGGDDQPRGSKKGGHIGKVGCRIRELKAVD